MESQPTGLLERLRVQRESMQAASAPPTPTGSPPEPAQTDLAPLDAAPPAQDVARNGSSTGSAFDPRPMLDEHGSRLSRLETEREEVTRRLSEVEANLRSGLTGLRNELPGVVASEFARHTTPINEAVTELGGRVGRVENEFSRERERWASVVTSFDQRLDQRLRSFRQDVTVMLTGMAVLVLAMLMLLLLRR